MQDIILQTVNHSLACHLLSCEHIFFIIIKVKTAENKTTTSPNASRLRVTSQTITRSNFIDTVIDILINKTNTQTYFVLLS